MRIRKEVVAIVFSAFIAVSAGIRPSFCGPLPDSDQTVCYDMNGDEILCTPEGHPLHGQDAQYHGPALLYTKQTINGDTIVTDINTGLLWQQNDADINGDGVITSYYYPEGDRVVWPVAVNYCESLTFGGLSDWRLPSATELDSIVDYGHYVPAMNPIFKGGRTDWSSTTAIPLDGKPEAAWNVDFSFGNSSIDCKTEADNCFYHNYIRCVHDSKN